MVSFGGARNAGPRAIAGLNRLGAPFRSLVGLSAEALAARATREHPEASFYPDALAGLRALCESLESDAALHLTGRIAAREDTLRLARTHLRIERFLHARPEIDDTPLLPPLFIVGLLRSGTSFLLGLLAADPGHRALPYYESYDPVPPARGEDRRVEQVDAMLARLEWIAPGYQAIHPMAGGAPEECVALFMNTFSTHQFDIQYRVPAYVAWLQGHSREPAYRHYRSQLRLVQHQRPLAREQRWLLKDPTHLFGLEALARLFPDARFVHLHRDPAENLASIASLYAHSRAIFSDDVDPEALGPEIANGYWGRCLEERMGPRSHFDADRVVDVEYADLVEDPIASAAAIYDGLGLTLSAEARTAMGRFVRAHPQRQHGVHVYSPEQFGLEAADLQRRFGRWGG